MIRRPTASLVGLFALGAGAVVAGAADWNPAEGPLLTRWAKGVSPANAHPEYPRPQMVRSEWRNLNGLWEYGIRPRKEERPQHFDGTILVPYPVESALSGVRKRVGPENRVWYRRVFSVPDAWRGERILLHFEAVDWEAEVWLDDKTIATHRGGYSPFAAEISSSGTTADRHETAGNQHELVVAVWDPSDAGTQPCGKQHNKPEGIWYTPSTGIWQTVWLEKVGRSYFRDLRFEPNAAESTVTLLADVDGPTDGCVVTAKIECDEPGAPNPKRIEVASADAAPGAALILRIPPEHARLWSPETPFLYDAQVSLQSRDGKDLDVVKSYVALRSIAVDHAPHDSVPRILLNGKPTFLIGPLDQGFWPDGLYAAPTDEALRFDLETTKRLGFNLVRKHVKVEPSRWYYWCDKLGLVVFQDMPSGGGYAKWPADGTELQRTRASADDYETELRAMIDSRRQFPCIVAWVPFNEGWGQFDTVRISKWVKEYDPSRLVDPASGGNNFPAGDLHDVHAYPGPKAPRAEQSRAAVLGEFGGLGLPIPGHLWQESAKNWGYRRFKKRDELTATYLGLAEKLRPLVESRLSAAVYTQTTDVETEVNGLLTYDRELIKMDAEKVRQANARLIHLLDGRK